ncbi:MAG: DUF885 family protein [Gemmatimonadota bacterium]
MCDSTKVTAASAPLARCISCFGGRHFPARRFPIVLLLLAAAAFQPVDAQRAGHAVAPESPDYEALLALHAEFLEVAASVIEDGVPNYTPAAMSAQHRAVSELLERANAMDSRAWPTAKRVDHLLVIAEMRALEFQHRSVRPWSRDPGFYAAISLGFGPKVHQALSVPGLPIAEERLDYVSMKLDAVPVLYRQARENLTEPAADLARLAMATKIVERNVMRQFAEAVAEHHPELAPKAHAAADAAEDYRVWIEERLPTMTEPAGVGHEDYEWYLRHVLLLPYTFDEMVAITEREYERSVAMMRVREFLDRDIPMPEPVESFEEYDRIRYEAGTELLAWLRENELLTLPEGLEQGRGTPPYQFPAMRDPAEPGPFDLPIRRHFFREIEDRDAMSLRGHDLPGHRLDALVLSEDDRPIRGRNSMYFVNGPRMEGWAYYQEEVIYQGGLLDDRPRATELHYLMQAKRAARVLPELMMHANEWDFATALESLITRTPYWMEPGDAIALFDMELYLRQPGYGLGYLIGKMQFEELLATRANQLGDAFDLREFHDEFLAAGVIPISLIRWEMTGLEDQVEAMW